MSISTLGGVDTVMRKFNSSTLFSPHSYLLTVSELLEAANKIHPNTDVELKVPSFLPFCSALTVYSGKTGTLWQVYIA